MNNNKEHDHHVAVEKCDALTDEMAKNKFKDICLEDFKKILNKVDIHHYDPDLDMVLECLTALKDSISLRNGFSNGNEVESDEDSCPKNLFQFHDQRAKYLFKILKQHSWFNELIKTDPRFNYLNNKTNKQSK